MAKYNLRFKRSVARDLRKIPVEDVSKILKRIDKLAENPRTQGCIKLAGENRYRTRVALYRIIYEIEDRILLVHIIKIGHRSSIYKG